ncbi:MAG: hypothetical protein ISS81_10545 [Candidatus Marinimicrobia bacterium]|nr:hypothetical protein [Candidatus Neomarinimicrobiota bacterium]
MKKANFILVSAFTILAMAMILPQLAYTQGPAIITIRPNAAGEETNLEVGGTASSAVNFENVDEEVSDDGGSYVVSKNSDTYSTDLYNLPDITSTSGTIDSVKVYINIASAATPVQTSAYTRIKTNGVAYNGTELTLTTSWTTYITEYTTNPWTTNEWTWAEVNALQAGVGLRRAKTGGQLQQGSHVVPRSGWRYIMFPNIPTPISRTQHGF